MPSYRIIQSGHIYEIYKYERSISYGYDDEFKSNKGGRDNEGIESRKEEYRGSVASKGYNKVRRLINANFTENNLFITLTYKKNMQDIEASNENFKKFVQKLKRRQSDFKYVAVMEFQKRGAIHYHMLCNYELVWNDHKELQSHERELGKVWGHGFVDVGYKKSDNAGAYLIKYMTKENIDDRLKGKKSYFFSRNLEQPKELTGGDALEVIKEFESLPPVYTSDYYSEFHGKVEYKEYNPMRYDYNDFKKSLKEMQDYSLNVALEMFGGLVEVVDA